MRIFSSLSFLWGVPAGALALAITLLVAPPQLRAQYDDQYDPFADFSEFEDDEQQRKDIEFFESGRLLTLGFVGGQRSWTDNNEQLFEAAPAFGLFLTYFFDLRFGMQVSFLTGDHYMSYPASKDGLHPAVPGNNSFTSLSIDIKYYFNTQNVTRGLAMLNPYVLAGFSQNYRTVTLVDQDVFNKETAFGANFALGIEIPVMDGKLFIGGQGLYRFVNFPDEGQELINTRVDNSGVPVSKPRGFVTRGDVVEFLGVMGINF